VELGRRNLRDSVCGQRKSMFNADKAGDGSLLLKDNDDQELKRLRRQSSN